MLYVYSVWTYILGRAFFEKFQKYLFELQVKYGLQLVCVKQNKKSQTNFSAYLPQQI
jgi:hypothetical protein